MVHNLFHSGANLRHWASVSSRSSRELQQMIPRSFLSRIWCITFVLLHCLIGHQLTSLHSLEHIKSSPIPHKSIFKKNNSNTKISLSPLCLTVFKAINALHRNRLDKCESNINSLLPDVCLPFSPAYFWQVNAKSIIAP
jgi:hypothetical protein